MASRFLKRYSSRFIVKQKKTSKITAFSLIELSIVILIISTVIVGVVKGSFVLAKSRLANAQVLTQNSPVINMPNLVAWYETSLESSFMPSEATDGSAVSIWYNSNPNAVSYTWNNNAVTATNKNDAVQTIVVNRPVFIENAINSGIPSLRFYDQGVQKNYLNFDGSYLINSSYTIFIVEQRRTGTANMIIGGSATTPDANLHIGYRSSTSFTQDHYLNGLDYAISTSTVPRIHTCMFSTANGKKYYLNGGSITDAADVRTSPLDSYRGSAIGKAFGENGSSSVHYNGDIAEIIIFNRAIKNEERQAIENYLSKKYGIAIS